MIAPCESLAIEPIERGEGTGGEERVAQISDGTFDAALFIAASGTTGASGEMVVAAEFEQAGVKVDSLAVSFEDDGLEIIVEAGSDDATKVAEGVDVALKKVLQRLVKEELEVEGAAIGESQDKAGEAALRATDSDGPERGPVDLSLDVMV